MSHDFIVILLAFLGACFGSFAGAQIWRLRARQLVEDKKSGEMVGSKEYKQLLPLTRHKGSKDRSRCLSCGHQLAWHDLVPLVSWLSTAGKCRYCEVKIGLFEPIIELSVAFFFVTSYIVWQPLLIEPLAVTQFVLWLAMGVMLTILAGYDLKWFILPDRIVFPLIALSFIYAILGLISAPHLAPALIDIAMSIMIMSGLYFALWLISKGKWIGFGDVKLGLALGLLLGSWQLALLALFLANLIGCLLVIPGLLTKKLTRSTQVPFGPMLIAGFVIAALFGSQIIDWYLSSTTPLML